MLNTSEIWIIIIGMAVINYSYRLIPLITLSRVKINPFFKRWLSFIPVSVMASIVLSEIFIKDEKLLSPMSIPYLVAAIPTGFVFFKTRSYVTSIIFGIGVFILFNKLQI